tara:strand:- start:306 stop:437 length:132 start_codon:yes stop_codon:yes gene_type:complete
MIGVIKDYEDIIEDITIGDILVFVAIVIFTVGLFLNARNIMRD